jgi:hypothetical protein
MPPIHSYVIRVSVAPDGAAWDVQVPGLRSGKAPTIQDAMKLALAKHVERIGHADARQARVFVTYEIEPEQIDDVITGAIE